ncbi:hypothetical protein [Massilia soli]|uniref:DUF2484 family protein n=1 Tax=Massilia soli TaxID=2792854 RepID=A0ABS7SID9_9BURK|nr:hypothetical protein [Massilia soli]MBZ2205978.1 hypothetical protein [Massilia soli]
MKPPVLPWRALIAANLWFAIACLAAGWLGLLLALPPGYASPLSPAAGIGIAVLAAFGWRLLPGLAVAAVMLGLPSRRCPNMNASSARSRARSMPAAPAWRRAASRRPRAPT